MTGEAKAESPVDLDVDTAGITSRPVYLSWSNIGLVAGAARSAPPCVSG